MVEPISSRYFPHPADGSGGEDGGSDPSFTDGQVPTVTMGWNGAGIPSYNLDPTGSGAETGHQGEDTPLNQTALVANPLSMRSVERDMLAATERGVNVYTDLKAKVATAIAGGAIYGQIDTDETWVDTTTVGAPPGQGYWRTDDSPLQETAREFADKMDDFQRGALIGVANALDTAGAFIAAVNIAGTTYSYVDRNAKFPEPPAA
ncbi:hypothetical protein [Actinoplanes sp. NPDC051851]|uniref:hypothetical protein n=1 Tax=Actinoplanes sp. NPDC051851 TaxID=3154753 RepID=UPI003423B4F2